MRRGILVLLLILGITEISAQAGISVSTAPGIYATDTQISLSYASEYDQILYRWSGSSDSQYLEYTHPIVLSTPQGTTRTFTLELAVSLRGELSAVEEYSWTIDRQAPGAVSGLPAGGYSESPIEISPMASGASGFEYSILSPDRETRETIERGESLTINGKTGEYQRFRLSIRAFDAAGNRGPSRTVEYQIDNRIIGEHTEIPLLSPVSGDFANRQLLYIDTRGSDEIRYTLDGSDPRSEGATYSEPVLLDSGRYRLRVWERFTDGSERYKTVEFSAGDLTYGGLEQGRVSSTVTVPVRRSGLYYRIDEHPAGVYDTPLTRSLRITVQPQTLRAIPLRIFDSTSQSEFRYLYLVDGIPPRKPRVAVQYFDQSVGNYVDASYGTSVSRLIRLTADVSDDTEYFYTLDGRLPASFSFDSSSESVIPFYGREEIQVPDGDGQVRIIVQSVKNGALWSEPSIFDYIIPATDGSSGTSEDFEMNISDDQLVLSSAVPMWVQLGSTIAIEPFILNGSKRFALPDGLKFDLEASARTIAASGRLGSQEMRLSMEIDTMPGGGPSIAVDQRNVAISGEGDIYYRLVVLGIGGEQEAEFAVYDTPFVLPEVSGQNVAYIVEAYVMGSDGKSPVVRSSLIPVHDRVPAAAVIAGVGNGDSINSRSVRLRVRNPEPAVLYRYSIAYDGENPQDPAEAGEDWNGGALDISLPEGLDTRDVIVSIRPVSSENSELVGPVSTISFTFDTSLPDIPVLSGIAMGDEFNGPISILLDSSRENEIYFSIQRNGNELIVPLDTIYSEAYEIPGIQTRRTDYHIRAYAVDPAGNKSENLEIDFVIDLESPEFPAIQVITEGGNPIAPVPSTEGGGASQAYVSAEKLELRFATDEQVVYSLTNDGSIPSVPGRDAPTAGAFISLPGSPSEERLYKIIYRSLDSAGNLSEASPVHMFVVDRMAPDSPSIPLVRRDGNRGLILFDTALDDISGADKILYALTPVEGGEPAFNTYNGAVQWEIPEGSEGLRISYQAVDAAGNRSSIQTLDIDHRRIAEAPKISGVQDGARYTSEQEIDVFPGTGGVIRYELRTDGTTPPAVTESSPIWSDSLRFTADEGETLEYRVRLRQFIGGYEPSSELNFSFIIDKTAPLPPSLAGVPEDGYSMSALRPNLSYEEGGQAVYELGSYVYPEGQLPQYREGELILPSRLQTRSFTRYENPLNFSGSAGNLTLYRLRAYSYDAAGNRSSQAREWSVFVDLRGVYVSPNAASDGDGSRYRPVGTIGQALQIAQRDNRREIYLSGGNYPMYVALEPDESISISGSYDDSWSVNTDAPSYLYPAKGYRGSSLIRVNSTTLNVSGLYLGNASIDLDAVVEVREGDFTASRSLITTSGSSSAIDASGGYVFLNYSEINGYELEQNTLVSIDGTRLEITDSRLSVEELPDFFASTTAANSVLIYARNAEVDIQASEVHPGDGQSTIGIYSYNSVLDIANKTTVSTGTGTSSASAIYAEESQINISASTIQGDSRTAVASLVAVKGGRTVIEDADLILEADFGVSGILQTGGSLMIRNSRISGSGGTDFTNALVVRSQGEVMISGTEVSGATGAEYIFLTLENSQASVSRSRIEFSAANSSGIGFQIGTGGDLQIEDSYLKGNTSATAILLQTDLSTGDLEVNSNVFEGWGLLLDEYRERFRTSEAESGRIRSLQQLEQIDEDGRVFSNNSVNQGL